jgi:hypothetical protein
VVVELLAAVKVDLLSFPQSQAQAEVVVVLLQVVLEAQAAQVVVEVLVSQQPEQEGPVTHQRLHLLKAIMAEMGLLQLTVQVEVAVVQEAQVMYP